VIGERAARAAGEDGPSAAPRAASQRASGRRRGSRGRHLGSLAVVLLGAGLITGLGLAQDAPEARGEAVFQMHCARCHNINGRNAVCPDLGDVGSRHDAAYLRESVVDPNAYIVPGFPKDVMLKFDKILKPGEIDDVVAYMVTLKGQTIDPRVKEQGVKW
jgi:mono/diheme cytochrome c family protein